jgi:acyl-coenzyme A thioesterase PaaI-like protein
MFAADEASRALGMELLEAAAARRWFRMPITAAMVNGHAIAHGGSCSRWPTRRSPAPATATAR